MVDFKTVKEELKKQVKSVRFFDLKTFKTYIDDQKRVARLMDAGMSNTEAWSDAEIYKTRFYNENSGAYCVFLEVLSGYEI